MSILSSEADSATAARTLQALQASLSQLRTNIEELSRYGHTLQSKRTPSRKSKRDSRLATYGMLQSFLRSKRPAEGSKPNITHKGISKELKAVNSRMRDLQQQHDQTTFAIKHYKAILAPISHVPYDVLELIFLYSLPSEFVKPSTRQSPLLLTMVCRKWRSIALSIPLLWSSLSTSSDLPRGVFSPEAPGPSNKKMAQLFKRNAPKKSTIQPSLWVNRAGHTPLRMEISIPKHVVWFTRSDPYFLWVTQTSERWIHLRLHTHPDYLSLLLSKPMPNLEVLELVAAHNHDPTTPIRYNDMFYLNPEMLSFPWTSLTTLLTLQIWLTSEQLIVILNGSPSLRSCKAKIYDKQEMSIMSSTLPMVGRWMVHASLVELCLLMNDYDAKALQHVLNTVILTRLENLRIVNLDECRSDWPHDTFITFAKQSQCLLQTLDIIGFSMITRSERSYSRLMDLGCIGWADPAPVREIWQSFPTLKRFGFI